MDSPALRTRSFVVFRVYRLVKKISRQCTNNVICFQSDDGNVVEVDGGLAGLLASIGLLVASVAELLVSGYSCLTLTPKLCGCLRANAADETASEGHLKTRNMVQQWVIAQNHMPKSQPIYVVQPVMPMHPMIQVNARLSSLTTSNYCDLSSGEQGGWKGGDTG